MNLSETILALDQKEEQLLAELKKVRDASVTIQGIFKNSKVTITKKVETPSPLKNTRDITDTINERNLLSAKRSILHLISKNGTTFESIMKNSKSRSGKKYSMSTLKRYVSTLTTSNLIERKKNRYFKLS
tara:strand:+ start:973 stop:1362 length:390 start_codon:yes stop_codon:yes gene_type:complete